MGHLSERNEGSPLVILRSVKARHCGDTPRDAVSVAEQRNYKWESRLIDLLRSSRLTAVQGTAQINISFMLRKIATRYGLNCSGIKSRWGRDFPHPPTQALGPTQPRIQCVPGLSRCLRGRRVALPPTPSSAEVKERAELYLCSPSELSCPVQG
jgi:hypothetical protein